MCIKKSLDVDDSDILSEISAERLGISETHRVKIFQILLQAGYVSGIEICRSISGGFVVGKNPLITLKGLEYLSENSIMQRLYKAAKGIKDFLPV